MDFAAHNEEVRHVWQAYAERRPIRVPINFGVSMRYFLACPNVNVNGVTWRQFSEDPEAMFDMYMRRHRFQRLNIWADWEMGVPAVEWPGPHVDFQNIYEAAWLGCEWHYIDDGGSPPDIWPIFKERKELLYETEIPDPLYGGLMGRSLEFYQYMDERRRNFEMDGVPVGKPTAPSGTDGPFTLACSLRGPTEVCLDMFEDENYYHDLMEFVLKAIVMRMRAWRKFLGQPIVTESYGFADDSIELLSPATYRRLVLPYHQRLLAEFAGPGPHSIHLCGRASHQFGILRDELNVQAFDVGFPTDMAAVRRELGPEVQLRGNIHPELLRLGPISAIREAVRQVMESDVREGGRFILAEGNNVAPHTPVEHLRAMYDAGKEFGRY